MDRDGILVRKAPLDGSEQIVVPKALRARLLHLEHFPKAVGHPGVTKMFRSMRRRYFWRHLFQDVENTVKQCAQCARNNVQERQHANYMKLFPANEPLEYVAIDLLGPLPKTAHGNRYLLVISDRFSKLTRTVPLRTTTALVVAKAFCTHWVYAYGIPKFLLSDNGTQFTSKFFLEVCRELGIAKVFTTAYHPQTNGQVERFNRTILNALRAYVAKRQTDWDEYTPSLTFGYNSQVHASSGIAPFDLVLSRPPASLSVERSEGLEGNAPADEKQRFLQRLKGLVPLAQDRLREAQRRYKLAFDRSVRPKNKDVTKGGWVFLRREAAGPEGGTKLDELADGPYEVQNAEGHTLVIRVGDDDIRVSADRVTPAPVPHVRPPLREESSTNPTGEDEGQEYVFERIMGYREAEDGSPRYRVRWYGYGRDADTWEPGAHLPMNALRRYHRRIGLPLPA
jgi:Integrase zinc binding domain/Integrase core domain/Chromo (CHRromatin Organisation MOdifier) domain